MKKSTRNILVAVATFVGTYITLSQLAKTHTEESSIDDDNPYLASNSKCMIYNSSTAYKNVYRDYIKLALDKVLSFIGLVILSPIFLVISLVLWVDDPGPIFFTQKRIGKNREFFMLHKFRSMKVSTPHDVPTHELKDPEQYITKVGRVLRRTSLDELPQIWDIFRGRMSVIGPRPALWNQDDLVAEREKYGANDVFPGLTGLAQIRGRDELEIAEKARIDGEYVENLHKGGVRAFLQDVECFFGTIASVVKHDGVVEGGTGSLHGTTDVSQVARTADSQHSVVEDEIEEYGFKKKFVIDLNRHVKVLITGAGSYIGESFERYCKEHYPNIEITTIDMIDGSWRDYDFTPFDTVFHVAGIAHADVDSVTEEEKKQYYAVNTDLAIETAEKSRDAGVSQFIYMSSMIIYGDSAPVGKSKVVDEYTIPSPSSFYGDSKWQGDKGVRSLQTPAFHVSVLRPPMIYGRGSKGNYPLLAKLARKLPFFPDVENSRSMLYIENLCEFVGQLICSGEGGIYFPQNAEYTKTSSMVKEIGAVSQKPVRTSKIFNPAVLVADKIPGKVSNLVSKAFGNAVYDQKLSQYEGLDYQKVDLKESIQLTEGLSTESMPDILFTIITVCLNNEDEIDRTISSVLRQTYPHIEYIIIDGNSTDFTVPIAEEYKNQFKNRGYKYTIVSEPDKGIYDAMNKGIKLASGEIIGFINAGDWYEENAVETAAREHARTSYDYFYADINLIRNDGSKIVKHSKLDHIATSRHWNHPSSFVTKRTYEDLGLFKCEGIHDDFDFYLRVRKSKKRILIVNKILANFRTGGTSNDKSIKKCMKRCKDRYRCYKENGYSFLYGIECVGVEIVKAVIS